MENVFSAPRPSAKMAGVLCGIGAAFCWGTGFVAARRGIAIGLAPVDIALHRYVWTGFILMPMVLRGGLKNFGSVGWARAIAATLAAGPLQAILSYSGFWFVPLGHGAVIQPASSALGGLLLAALFLHEPLRRNRLFGAMIIVAGLAVFSAEALTMIGMHGFAGDMLFAAAGFSFAIFAMLVRLWQISGTRAAAIVAVLSLVIYAPIHGVLFGYDRIIAAGFWENALQIVVQGGLAGAFTIYLFTRAVTFLGAGRASIFSALVPAFALLIGYITLGEAPSLVQLAGLGIVAIGFRLVLKP